MVAVDPNFRASVVGIETKFQQPGIGGSFAPMRIAVIGQGATAVTYSTTKKQVLTSLEVGQEYGFGSPIHLAVKQLFPTNGGGVGSIPVTIYPLEDDGAGVAAAGDVTPIVAQTISSSYRVSVNNILSNAFVVTTTDTVATVVTAMTTAINAVFDMPMIATDSTTKLDLVAKWAGESSNDLQVEIIGDFSTGVTFGITQPVGGLVNPDVQPALDQFGQIWETLVLNCMNKSDLVTVGLYTTFGEARWEPLVKKPMLVFTGDINATVADATTIPESLNTNRVHSQLVSPAAVDLPLIVAARQLTEIALIAESNPPTGYNGAVATGLTPSVDSATWDVYQRDEAVKKGSSTITVENGQVVLGDIATYYHPDGDEVPAYRWVVNIIKLMNIIYDLNAKFEAQEWRDAPLIPDLQPTVNPNARSPATARAEVAGLISFWGDWAIISDPEAAKKLTVAQINEFNPNRLDITLSVNLSGNAKVKAITQTFSFLLGGV